MDNMEKIAKKTEDELRREKKQMEDDLHSESQARAKLADIVEMMAALKDAGDDDKKRDDAQQTIDESILECAIRLGWHQIGKPEDADKEFMLLLCTGGPAVRVRGELDQYNNPENVVIEHQDWFTLWQEFTGLTDVEEKALLNYACQFYFGE